MSTSRRAYRHGRHEHGQNFLDDRAAQDAIVARVRATDGPIIEIGPGAGHLTGPAQSFTPPPSVDGGLMTITRRDAPVLAIKERRAFQRMAHQVFTGRGRGIVEIATRAGLFDRPRGAPMGHPAGT